MEWVWKSCKLNHWNCKFIEMITETMQGNKEMCLYFLPIIYVHFHCYAHVETSTTWNLTTAANKQKCWCRFSYRYGGKAKRLNKRACSDGYVRWSWTNEPCALTPTKTNNNNTVIVFPLKYTPKNLSNHTQSHHIASHHINPYTEYVLCWYIMWWESER